MANYLYNGVELPEITFEEEYPYIFITRTNSNQYTAHCSKTSIDIRRSRDGSEYVVYPENPCKSYYYVLSEGDYWQEGGTNNWGGSRIVMIDPVWTNTELRYPDNTLYLAASDPVPVGSAPEVEPKSFMAGSWMGQVVNYYRIGA